MNENPVAEKISNGLSRLSYRDGKIIVFKLSDTERETIDQYMAVNDTLLKSLPAGHRLYAIQDFSDPEVLLTPYFRKRLDEAAVEIRKGNIAGCNAVVLPNTLMNQIFSIYTRIFARRVPNTEQRMFTSLDAALEWLDKKIAEQEISAGNP